ncbi:cytochrome P450 [Russula vinacea]|nr:cytochrome P450 [Russula vinacea]
MPTDEFTLRVSFLMGFFVVLSLFVGRHFRRDPMTRPGLFKIADFRRWLVLPAGSEFIEDVRKAPEEVLSMREPAIEFFQLEYTLDLLDMNDSYHTDVIRTKLTRNIAATFKDVREEFVMAMNDLIPMRGDVAGAENSQGRNHDYQTLNLMFTVNLMRLGRLLRLFPKPLKLKHFSIVSRMLSNLPSIIQQEIEFIRPMVEERLRRWTSMGRTGMISRFVKPLYRYLSHYPPAGSQNDLLMWLMSEAKGVERSLEGVARRLLLANAVSIHTTSLASDDNHDILYDIALIMSLDVNACIVPSSWNPEYIEPLRQEVDAVITKEGWTKAGIDKMHKVDSFLRETQRLDEFTILPSSRLALRPFTFSNGVTVPAGTLVSYPTSAIHTDERIYLNPDEFDGFACEASRD